MSEMEKQKLIDLCDELEMANELKDKVIDLMAYELALPGRSIEIVNLYSKVSPDKPIYDLVKEYFYKKAEEERWLYIQ